MARRKIKDSTGETQTQTPSVQLQGTQSQQQDEQGRLLGGALPIAGGIIGGTGGSIFGFPGAVGGATIGASSGVAVENLLEDLLGRQQETPQQQLGTATREGAAAGAGEALGLGVARLGGKVLGPIARPVHRLLSERLAPGLVRTSISEPRRILTRTLQKIAGEEVERGAGEVVERPTKQLSQEIVERGETGSAKQLLKRAQGELKDVAGSLTSRLDELSKTLPGKPDIDSIMADAVERADEGLPGAGQTDQLLDLADDILKKQRGKINDWGDLLDFRKNLDKIAGGKVAEETPAAVTSLRRALADEIRGRFPEEMQRLISEQQFYILLRDAAAGKAASGPLSRGDVFTLLVGGAPGFLAGSFPGAALGVSALKAPFSPLFATNAAQLLRGLVPAAGRAATAGLGATGQAGTQSLLRNLLPNQSNQLNQ